MLKNFVSLQFFKFIGVGATAALLHWLARILLSHWLNFSASVALAYGVGILVAYILNAAFVFPNSSRPKSLQIRDFTLVNLGFFPVVWGLSLVFKSALFKIEWSFFPEAFAHGAAISVPMFATFLIYKFFTFNDTEV